MESKIGADLLRGVKAISRFISEDQRATYHKLSRGYVPAGKEGSEWVASKHVLREHYARLTGAIADTETKKLAAVKPAPETQIKKQTKDQGCR
jgi:hypothetical protein